MLPSLPSTGAVAALALMLLQTPVLALDPAQKALFDSYQSVARGDAARGKLFFLSQNGGGKADSPSCASCHTANPANSGKTRAGKDIGPMAASLAPKRYTDPAEVEKWFKRNCSDVLGRACTPQEKSDVLAYFLSL